jgi:hypothetical protein
MTAESDKTTTFLMTIHHEDKAQRARRRSLVVRKRPLLFQLLSEEDQPLLIRRDSFLVLGFTSPVVSTDPTSGRIVLSVSISTKIRIPPRRWGSATREY